MTAVADTSPRVVLGKIRRLDLLRALYGDVVLPAAVAEEVLAKPDAIQASEPRRERWRTRGSVRARSKRRRSAVTYGQSSSTASARNEAS